MIMAGGIRAVATACVLSLASLNMPPLGVLAFAAEPSRAVCHAPSELVRLAYPLVRTAQRLNAGEPLKIVAIGSSSTAGAGASSPDASYPSRLAVELKQRFPNSKITVVNNGINGEEVHDMLARFQTGVISEKPDLVIWQLGTNAVLRDDPLTPAASLIREGIKQIRSVGADVVLMDPQFAPRVIAKAEIGPMETLLSTTAKELSVDLFQRYAMMRIWRETDGVPFDAFVTPDGVHMNDWGYACVAKLLASSIVDASTRVTASVQVISHPGPRETLSYVH